MRTSGSSEAILSAAHVKKIRYVHIENCRGQPGVTDDFSVENLVT